MKTILLLGLVALSTLDSDPAAALTCQPVSGHGWWGAVCSGATATGYRIDGAKYATTLRHGASVTNTGAPAVSLEGPAQSLTNHGTIRGRGGAGVAMGQYGHVQNLGTIASDRRAVRIDGRYSAIRNLGRIEGRLTAVEAFADGPFELENLRSITSRYGDGVSAGDAAAVTNGGTITGGIAGLRLRDGAAVANDGEISGQQGVVLRRGAVTNGYGATITGTNGSAIQATGGATVGNDGLVTGRIGVSGTAEIRNAGVIEGAQWGLRLGNGADSYTGDGEVHGRASFGGGADLLALTGSGWLFTDLVDGGWGRDTFRLDGADLLSVSFEDGILDLGVTDNEPWTLDARIRLVSWEEFLIGGESFTARELADRYAPGAPAAFAASVLPSPVPLPGTALLILPALAALALLRRR